MRVLAHPDPFVLEDALLKGIAAAQADDPLARVLVVVPTVRLARHITRRLGERKGACLAVEILNHRALAYRILDSGPGPRPRIVSNAVLRALVDRVVSSPTPSPWSRFLAERPGARRALHETLLDLREAGISSEEAVSLLRGDERERALAAVYAGYVRGIESAAPAGLVDEAGLVAAALPRTRAFGSAHRAVFHHGAYELTGIHLALLREVDRAIPVTFFLPCEPDAPAYATAERFAREHLLAEGDRIERIGDREGGLLGSRLSSAYEEGKSPPPPAPRGVLIHNVQGALAEVTLAARHALRSVAAGTDPAETALMSRSLSPYSSALEEVLDGEGIPWTSSLRVALRRDPVVHDLLLLLRMAARGYPRAGTAEILGSPRLRWAGVLPGERRPRGDRARVWSRRAGILGGLPEWTSGLLAWARASSTPRGGGEEDTAERRERAERRIEDVSRVVRALSSLDRRIAPERTRTWPDHADVVLGLIQDVLPGLGDSPPSSVMTALLKAIDDLRVLPAFVGAERVTLTVMIDALERAVDESELPAGTDPASGIHVLDAMQARGMTFRRVHLMGFHTGLFPRVQRADPFLPDAARRLLREATSRPVPVKSDSEKEEHLLLALMLGSARDHVRLSWQRADDAGRARTPSLVLREVARVTLGVAELGAALAAARPLPAHPAQSLDRLATETGLLSPLEDQLLAALRARGIEDASEALESRAPALAPRLSMMRATESFATEDPRWDGRVDPRHVPPDPFTPSRLEALGRCPLRYFFRHVLRVREPDREVDPFDLDSREMGSRVHRVLEAVYRTLAEERLFEPLFHAALHDRALALVSSEWKVATRDLAEGPGARVPVLWSLQSERWRASLERFVLEDLSRLVREGLRPVAFEDSRRASIKLARKLEIEVSARFDRTFSGRDGILVSDYKTGKLSDLDDVDEMLRGRRLQIPLYRILAGEGARVETLGVGPSHQRVEGEDEPAATGAFSGFARPEQEEGFRETLGALVSMAREGRFPLHTTDCAWCPYTPACRHNHPPTLERERNARDVSQFFGLQKKESAAPLLARRGTKP